MSVEEVLITTLEHAADPMPASQESQLREFVQAFVDDRRNDTPPERLIVELKDLVRSALRKRRLASPGQHTDDGRLLLEQIVRWAIARYYER